MEEVLVLSIIKIYATYFIKKKLWQKLLTKERGIRFTYQPSGDSKYEEGESITR